MKRILGLVVLFTVLSTCVPSFGNYFLLYNVSTTVKGVDYDDAEGAVTVPTKGYLLLTLDDSNEFVDANLVLYGKNTENVKVFVELGYNDIGFLGDTYTWAAYGYFFIYLQGMGYFDFEAQLIGKTKLKDIGLGTTEKKDVASRVKGVIAVWEDMLLDSSQDIKGTANMSMTLNNRLTKSFNDTEPTWDANSIMNGQEIEGVNRGIKPDLVRKGYDNATPIL